MQNSISPTVTLHPLAGPASTSKTLFHWFSLSTHNSKLISLSLFLSHFLSELRKTKRQIAKMKASAAATSSIRNLLSKSLSSKQKSNSKISKSNSENTPPLHPNIVQSQLSPTPPPAKSLTFHSQSQIPRSDTPPEVFESQEDSQLKVFFQIFF